MTSDTQIVSRVQITRAGNGPSRLTLEGWMFRHCIKITVCAFALLGLPATAVHGALIATFVKSSFTTFTAPGGGAEFDSASVTVFIDPAATQWIAWNDTPTVSRAHPSRPGEFFLGPGGIGVDDYLRLSIVNPSSQPLAADIDQNDGFAVSFGTQ